MEVPLIKIDPALGTMLGVAVFIALLFCANAASDRFSDFLHWLRQIRRPKTEVYEFQGYTFIVRRTGRAHSLSRVTKTGKILPLNQYRSKDAALAGARDFVTRLSSRAVDPRVVI